MLKRHNPATVAAPFSRYSHGVEAPDNARWLVISGQVGVTARRQGPERRKGADRAGLAQSR